MTISSRIPGMSRIRRHPAHRYAEQVVAGKIPAGTFAIQACQRYLRDLDNASANGWTFNSNAADDIITWMPSHIRHTGGMYAGQPFELMPWQQFIVWNLFGWQQDGKRRFKYAYIEIPKKNGKTTLASAMLLYMLLGTDEASPQVYTAATRMEQAKICFDEACNMRLMSRSIMQVTDKRRNQLRCDFNFGIAAPLSSDSTGYEGINVYFAVIDEYHASKTDEVYNALQSGMIARQNPLHFTITTAGFNLNGPCFKLHKTCADLLAERVVDESLFCIMHSADEDDDWSSPVTWQKANPSIGHSVTLESMEKEYHQAHTQGGTKVINFKTKHLNVWCQTDRTWIDDQLLRACTVPPGEPLGRLPVFIGLDLANVRDITAMACLFEMPDGKVRIRMRYWLPEDTVAKLATNQDTHPYIRWARDGHITLTPGNVTDYAFIRRAISGVHILEGRQTVDSSSVAFSYDLKLLGYDRFNASQIMIELEQDGVPTLPYGQGFRQMSFPMKQLERMIYGQLIQLEDDPVLRWMFANVRLQYDSAGNIKADKGRSQDKIDGVVALVMALGTWMAHYQEAHSQPTPSIVRI